MHSRYHRPLGCEKVDLLSALGRVNGEEIHARREIPPKDNSAMDGYALISADTLGASTENPAVLEIVEDIAAGRVPRISIHSGQAARIMTGHRSLKAPMRSCGWKTHREKGIGSGYSLVHRQAGISGGRERMFVPARSFLAPAPG